MYDVRCTIFSLILLIGLFWGACVAAQTPEEMLAQPIADLGIDEFSAPSVDLTPSVGGTVGSVTAVTATTANIDNNASVFEWYLDDALAPSRAGRAVTSFSFRTTKQTHLVRLVISQDAVKITENTVAVHSFTVTLAWAADTFVPGRYDGKALPSVGSRVTVSAYPEMRDENPENLLYTWYLDAESRVRNVVGEQDFTFHVTKYVKSVSVIVEVSNASQSISVRSAINIPVMRPSVAVSPTGPAVLSAGGRAQFLATPLYFHVGSLNEITFEWIFSGQSTFGIPPDPHILTLAVPQTSGAGSEYLTLTATNQQVLGENAKAEVEIYIL